MCDCCVLNGRCSGCDDAGWFDYQQDEEEREAWLEGEYEDRGLYSPSMPWNAPGMRVSDFI